MTLPRYNIGDTMPFTDNGVQKTGLVTGVRWNGSSWVYTLTVDETSPAV